MEKFETFENGPTRVAVVEALKTEGIDDAEVQALLDAYVEKKEKEATQENTSLSNAEVALHMVDIYFEARYIDYVLESLDELEQMNEGDEFYQKVKAVRESIENNLY